jgi:hypothetical protein
VEQERASAAHEVAIAGSELVRDVDEALAGVDPRLRQRDGLAPQRLGEDDKDVVRGNGALGHVVRRREPEAPDVHQDGAGKREPALADPAVPTARQVDPNAVAAERLRPFSCRAAAAAAAHDRESNDQAER